MRATTAVLLAALALVGFACSGDGAASAPDEAPPSAPSTGDDELAALARAAVATHGLPAVAVARASIGEVVHVAVAGTRSHTDSTPLGVEARWHLGSDTKAMTAVLVAQLVESGELRFDTRVAEVLPDAPIEPSRSAITVRDVLGHRTGLADDFDLGALHAATDAVAARRAAVDDALASRGAAPGEYRYANVNYMLAGVLVEQITGEPWVEVIQERLFAPLDMRSCGFGAPPGALDPLGHTADGAPIPQDAPVSDNPPALGPAGTVHCSVSDWARFVTAVLRALRGTDTEVLAAATAADLFAGTEQYVAGWLRSERSTGVSYGHDGSNTLWYARAVLRPDQGDAVLLATNTGEASATRALDDLTSSLLEPEG